MAARSESRVPEDGVELFKGVSSSNFLSFEFAKTSYTEQLRAAVAKTGKFCAVTAMIRTVQGVRVMWLSHDFGFLGGSLGCAEGERLVLGIEMALDLRIPVVFDCRSGGARMQEGTLALMQLAKVSVAVQALRAARIPVISVNKDPTYGGVSASYAMQGDVRIGVRNCRIGFAGPAVILNTMYEMNQAKYDEECPEGFQTAEFLKSHGQLDIIIDEESALDDTVARVLRVLACNPAAPTSSTETAPAGRVDPVEDYQAARRMDRYQCQDVISSVFANFVELSGDGKVGSDRCIRGGLATFEGAPCVVIATFKGHGPLDMKDANFGMASPHGYRFAKRLLELAAQFGFPVFTLVDTCGAYPSFDAEANGQSEAIASNLLAMAGLTVPIISLILGEGGSGGALGIAMGNRVGMMARAYYGVISPEGAASILGRYKDDAHKALQFPLDCRELANAQRVYAHQLLELGVVDEVVREVDGETYDKCPGTMAAIRSFFLRSITELAVLTPQVLFAERYSKFRRMGKFDVLSVEEQTAAIAAAPDAKAARSDRKKAPAKDSRTLNFIAHQTLNSEWSMYRSKCPTTLSTPVIPPAQMLESTTEPTAKQVLDAEGPDAVVAWVRAQKRVLVSDTTMRDAHQSLLATRVRTRDLLDIAEQTNSALSRAFSLEMWGGATFDVAYRFLHESPWERLRYLRKKIPNIMFQMLVRGANCVGYKSYPDNVVVEFIKLAAAQGIDVFRIFDCFNDVSQMKLCIDTVRAVNKIAEVCICFTGNFLSPDEKIYTLDYYKEVARQCVEAGAHILAIKDMAGLLRPQGAAPLVEALRSVTDLPLHYHTHNTSSASLATCLNMADAGCEIIDACMASMADTTSQPSINAFLAALQGTARDPLIDYLSLEPLDNAWARIRELYWPFESGLKSGSARVYEHQIPGGQYSNLYAQCKSMGLMDRWEEVLDMYRDVNLLFGDIIKVTPSSKCVGDLALFLVTRNLTCDDVKTRTDIQYPASVVDLFVGALGRPHHGFPDDITKRIIGTRTVMTGRPGDTLAPADFAATRTELTQKFLTDITDEDVVSYLLYPQVFEEYMAHTQKYGTRIPWLVTEVVLYGMFINQETTALIPNERNDAVEEFKIRLRRVSPLQQGGIRTLVFEVNGEERTASIKDATVNAGVADMPMADPADPRQIGSPLPGTVDKVFVERGGSVKEGQKIMTVSAMKMEVQVTAPFDGVVDELCVAVGAKVCQGALLARLKQVVRKSLGMPRIDSLATGLSEMGKQSP